jgi:Glycosyl hydrolase family 26
MTAPAGQQRGAHRGPRRPMGSLLRRRARLAAVLGACATGIAGVAIATWMLLPASAPGAGGGLTTAPGSYLGIYLTGIPGSYSKLTKFSAATQVKPNLVVYYSAWSEPFRSGFARTAAADGAVPLVQINPAGTSLAAIAAGRYDDYLDSYAAAVRSYQHPVIVGFGHEMNGWWYSWGYRHTSPAVFLAAWRHVVTLFRARGARNVTWLWTVNVIDDRGGVRDPSAWWPGARYVDWVGLDGYYRTPAWRFASLFGPTIKKVRSLTRDPILISETAASASAAQPAKIADLFAGVRAYGLLGVVWFDAVGHMDWRIRGPASIAALRRAARSYPLPDS